MIRLLFVALFVSRLGPAELAKTPASPQQVSPPTLTNLFNRTFEKTITALFVANNCPEIVTVSPGEKYLQANPLIRAVIAFCQTDEAAAETMFQSAEAEDPTNDLIYALHGRYLYRISPDLSYPVWQKVLLYAKSRAVKLLAKDYLEDTVEAQTDEEIIPFGRPFSYYLNLQAGGGAETNPTAAASSVAKSPSSKAFYGQFNLGGEYNLGFANLTGNYGLTFNKYFSTSNADLQEHDFDLPFVIKTGTSSDLQIRPFASYLVLGNRPYQVLTGLSLIGTAYRSDFRQWVQGSFFRDHYYSTDLQAQEGIHFRFDYNWEWYPADSFLKFIVYVEHSTADDDVNASGTLQINYSHNDIGLLFFGEYNLKWIVLGLYPRILLREDDNDSVYVKGNSSTPISKRREDLLVAIQPNISFPLDRGVRLFLWYEWASQFSNIGPSDYIDRNFKNQTVGLSLKIFYSGFL